MRVEWTPHHIRKGTWTLVVSRGTMHASYELIVTNAKPARDGASHWHWSIRRYGHATPVLLEGHAHNREKAQAMAITMLALGMTR